MTGRTRLAIDVGGTFTDVVTLAADAQSLSFDKVPTTPSEPTKGVLDAFEKSGAAMLDIAMFTHGTTLGLNALLTRNGARTAVIGTKGFRDVYLLGRTDRRTNYDITYRKPPALLERFDTYEVAERTYFDGSIHTPFDDEDARRVAQTIGERGYESVAVAFLHSYVNPEHELRMRDILLEEIPGLAVTLSHELSREYREYERTSTAVLDAYIKPIVRRYLEVLEDSLVRDGFGGQFLMTRSGGGAMTARVSREQPVSLILSGPAGGVIGAAALSHTLKTPNMITIDMGGTSLDASLVLDGEAVLYQGAEFEGLPINTPSLYIHTIGAGGGSLAWLDDAGALQVGPQSAGADPGPAAYGRGGTQPTFTDAALVIGYMGSESPLGGSLSLDLEKATAALEPIANELGMSVHALAKGVVRISTMKIMGAVRAITVELGRDPKDFSLLSFGGGGGLVAVDVAAELEIPTVIIPPGQGAFSALGMLMADVQHDFSRTRVTALAQTDIREVEQTFAAMEREATAALRDEGFSDNDMRLQRSIDVRYAGQEHSVTLPLSSVDNHFTSKVESDFSILHERQYGHVMNDPIEITTLRLRATGTVEKPGFPLAERRTGGQPEPYGTRAVYVDAENPAIEYRLYIREDLRAGDQIDGPAVIAEHTATTVIHSDDVLRVGDYGELVITKGAGRGRTSA